jgi:hypothetical protein
MRARPNAGTLRRPAKFRQPANVRQTLLSQENVHLK